MSLVQRAKNICITPKTEWPVIAAEPESTGGLIAGYVAPLALISPIFAFISASLIGHSLPFLGNFKTPIVLGLTVAVATFVFAIIGVFIVALIVNALAPSFGGEKNSGQALKVVAYSYTPAWIAGVFHIIPGGTLLVVLASLYGLYLLYLGLPALMKCPADKAVGYTVVTVICAIVVSIVLALIVGLIGGAGMLAGGALQGGLRDNITQQRSSGVTFDKDSPMGKLEALGKKMEESGKKMEDAQKRGDTDAQAKAAMETLGTLMGGGRHVDPLGLEEIKPFVPESFAGMPRTSSKAEKSGVASLMVSTASAHYSDGGQRSVALEITDTGGASGLMGLASWVGVTGEKEDDYGSEKTQRINGRLVHEKISKQSASSEYSIVLGDRFIVSAKSQGVDLPTLRSAVTSLDLAKLESLKDAGVQK